jgi:hypothetical protein
MPRPFRLLLPILGAVVLGAGLLVSADSAAAGRPSTDEPTGCDVTFRGTNSGSSSITFEHGLSRVKVRRLTWKKLGSWSQRIVAGGSLSSTVRLDFGCGAQRQYKLYFERSGGGGDVSCYYPSSGSFTESQAINLGDVDRYFDPARSTSSCRG